jgi:hypothetical protein
MSRLQIPSNECQFICTSSDVDDMAIQKALTELVEIQNSGRPLTLDQTRNLAAIITLAHEMLGILQ